MTKDIFFGRKAQIELLNKRISSLKDGYRQNLAIIGDELVGKTSLIFRFLSKYCDNRTILIYLEVRPESLSNFTKRFIGVLLYNFLSNSNTPLKEDLDFLLQECSKYIPKTVEKINGILASLIKRKKINIFSELLSLTDSVYQESGKYCVVIFDEFQNLEHLGIKDLYLEWSKLLIVQKTTMYIVTSSMKFKAKNILSKNLASLFGNFETIALEPFDLKTCEEYLKCKLEGLNLDKGLDNFIVHFTGGCPFYLELITQELAKSKQPNLTDIIQNQMFEPSGILNQRFTNYLKKFLDSPNSQDYVSIMHQVSSGHNKINDIAHILRKQKSYLTSRINHLLESDCLTKSGDFLTINDRVLSFWMNFVYQEKLHSLTFDAKNQKMIFRDKIEKMIRDFLIAAKKPVIERMSELFHLFEDDTMQIEKKKFKLDRFREIKPLILGGKSLKDGLIGRSNDSVWIMGFKRELITEDDVTDFAKECKKYRNKLQHKIILTTQEVDSNARLRALEEKILTWDLNSINHILDLYSKPRIVA